MVEVLLVVCLVVWLVVASSSCCYSQGLGREAFFYGDKLCVVFGLLAGSLSW